MNKLVKFKAISVMLCTTQAGMGGYQHTRLPACTNHSLGPFLCCSHIRLTSDDD